MKREVRPSNEEEITFAADGHREILETIKTPIFRNDGKLLGVLGVGRDITQRKKTEEKIRYHEMLLEEVGRIANIGGWEFDPATGEGSWTAEVARIHDLDPEEPVSVEKGLSFFHEANREAIENAIRKGIETGQPWDLELEMVSAKGIRKWIHTRGRPKQSDGKVTQILGSFQDITTRRQLETEHRETNERLRLALQATRMGTWEWDIDTDHVRLSPETLDTFGINEEAFGGTLAAYLKFIPPQDRNRIQRIVMDFIKTVPDPPLLQYEHEIIRADGISGWVEIRGSVTEFQNGSPRRMTGICMDISHLKTSAEALKSEALRRRLLVEHSRDGIVILNQDGSVNETNKRFAEMLGYTREEVMQMHVWDWDAVVSPELILKMIQDVDEHGDFFETRHRRRDGSLIDMEISTNGVIIDGQKLVFCVCRDITERKLAEAERERLITAINQAADSIVITDLEGYIEYVNPAFESITGYSGDEAVGKELHFLQNDGQSEDFHNAMWEMIQAGKTWRGHTVNKRKDGTRYTEAATISPIRNSEGKIISYVAVKRDISEHQRLEEQFRQAQKMESVGRLAGGIAHDYNNILSVILGSAELMIDKVPPTDPMHEDLKQILLAAERSRDITRQLLAFARKQTIAPKVMDLNETVGNMLTILRRLVGEDIDLVWIPGINLWPVKMDPSQLDQILANLCVNARDAIADVGRITMATGNITLDDTDCEGKKEYLPGEYTSLTISDTGTGMSEAVLQNIFEPFYTTKEIGKGTGLGLATVYGIVKQNNGFIHVDSEPGKGTTFNIFIPRCRDVIPQVEQQVPETVVNGSGETIMLVEDESAILKIAQRILTRLNYNVLTAFTPGEARRICRRHEGRIDLLITDVVMPEMNGRELAEHFNIRHPGMKCLYISGYTAEVIAHRGILDEGVNFLQKPFSTREFSKAVYKALHSS